MIEDLLIDAIEELEDIVLEQVEEITRLKAELAHAQKND